MEPLRRRIAALVCLVATGCSSTYVPRPSPRVALAMVDGDLALVKNGQATGLGIFGGGLEEAVYDNPEARESAETFGSFTIGGFVVGLLGLGATAGGLALWLGNESGDRDDGLRTAGIGLTIGGAVLSFTGGILQMAAQPHLYDAINIYNDAVDPGAMSMPPSYGPDGAYPPSPGAYPAPPPIAPTAIPPAGPPEGSPPVESAPPPAQPPDPAMPPEPESELPSPEEPPPSDDDAPAPTSPVPSPNP